MEAVKNDALIKATEAKLEALKMEYIKKEEALLDPLSAEERAAVGHPIKTILTMDTFMANGHRYTIRTSLTISRFEQFEQLQVQVGYGVDFRNLFALIRKSFDYLNEGQQADAAVVLYNIMNGVKNNLDKRKNEVLLLCTLFICRDNEDVKIYDEALSLDKINDWTVEGISIDNFFSIAFSCVDGFSPIYKEVSASILSHQMELKNQVEK